MKAKLKTALKSNVDPFFFVLACVVLFSVSMTAKTLADDVLSAVDGPNGTAMTITTDGQVVWQAE
jgi:hypothetical protein